ncbi:hypothetical protein ABRT01_18240 [Lentibacillus sp. L22]|nr:hypothetical protein [Lentibacillus daqui]
MENYNQDQEEKNTLKPELSVQLSCHHALVHNPFVWEDDEDEKSE